MKWLYYLWAAGFTSGRIYGNKGADWRDERPRYNADLGRLLFHLHNDKAPCWLVWLVEREQKRSARQDNVTK